MKRAAVFFFVILSVLILSITLDQIREVSNKDPERAFELLVNYLKSHPGDEKAARLGKVISAKRVLSKIPEIREDVLKERVFSLIDDMASLSTISKEMMGYIEVVFPNFYNALREKVMNFDERAFKVCYMLPERVREPKGFENVIVERYFEDPLRFDPRVIYKLKCMNLPRLKGKIKKVLEEKLGSEENYVKAITLADMLMIELPSSTELHTYADIVYKINSPSSLLMSKEDFLDVVKKYESLHIKKEILGKRIKELYMKLSQREDLSGCKDVSICPPIKRTSQIGKSASQTVEEQEATQLKSEATKTSVKLESSRPERKEMLVRTVAAVGVSSAAALIVTLVFIRLRDPKRRIKMLLKKLSSDPTNPELHMKLAELYEEIGRMEQAMEEYKLASKLFNYESGSSENDRN